MRIPTGRFAAIARAGLLVGILAAAALGIPAGAAATTVSSNWAGYVAHSTGSGFTSVSADWTVPGAACTAGHETHSAVWVGLGGYRIGAQALEQIGTEADCTAAGRALYSSWVELLPAGAQNLRLPVRPGDRIVASVTVLARHATLRIRDLTNHRSYSTTRRLHAVDVSTADWIVEAPSGCAGAGGCRTLDLANFGTVSFSDATATAAAQNRTLSSWNPNELLLRQPSGAAGASAARGAGIVSATPNPYQSGSFSVTYGESAGDAPEGPVLPGFSGGGE